MKKLILTALLFATSHLLFAEVSASDAARSLPGVYTAYFSGGVTSMKVTFAVSQKLQLKVVKSEPEYVSGQLHLASPDSEFGPNGLPIATFYFLTGSDEDTMAYVMRVSFEKDGFVKVRYLDSVSTFNDGPNDSSHVTAAKAKLFKQSAKTGKFFPIK